LNLRPHGPEPCALIQTELRPVELYRKLQGSFVNCNSIDIDVSLTVFPSLDRVFAQTPSFGFRSSQTCSPFQDRQGRFCFTSFPSSRYASGPSGSCGYSSSWLRFVFYSVIISGESGASAARAVVASSRGEFQRVSNPVRRFTFLTNPLPSVPDDRSNCRSPRMQISVPSGRQWVRERKPQYFENDVASAAQTRLFFGVRSRERAWASASFHLFWPKDAGAIPGWHGGDSRSVVFRTPSCHPFVGTIGSGVRLRR
jgi:hypothetical protein